MKEPPKDAITRAMEALELAKTQCHQFYTSPPDDKGITTVVMVNARHRITVELQKE